MNKNESIRTVIYTEQDENSDDGENEYVQYLIKHKPSMSTLKYEKYVPNSKQTKVSNQRRHFEYRDFELTTSSSEPSDNESDESYSRPSHNINFDDLVRNLSRQMNFVRFSFLRFVFYTY